MADVKWIKIAVDMFENRKIKQLEAMPEGDALIVIWQKLLCLAGSINDNGAVYLTQNMPYSEESLAAEFRKPLNTVRLALATFEKFNMIEVANDIIYIANWEKYQEVDKLAVIKEQNRIRQKAYYERQKALEKEKNNVSLTLGITSSNAIDIDKDIEEDIDINNSITNINITNTCPLISLTPNEKAVISLILNNKKYFNVYEEDIKHYQFLYPAVEILQELKFMCGWLESNPANRKTEKGIKSFITRWLSKKQNQAPKVSNNSRITEMLEELKSGWDDNGGFDEL